VMRRLGTATKGKEENFRKREKVGRLGDAMCTACVRGVQEIAGKGSVCPPCAANCMCACRT
jgi:hypothetical protein